MLFKPLDKKGRSKISDTSLILLSCINHINWKILVLDTMFTFEDYERFNKARKLNYHSDERFSKDLYNGHMVFVSKFMHWADFNVLSSQLQNRLKKNKMALKTWNYTIWGTIQRQVLEQIARTHLMSKLRQTGFRTPYIFLIPAFPLMPFCIRLSLSLTVCVSL